MDSNDAAHLTLLKRPELGITFTKLSCWTLTEYNKCVFMDADTMALANIDELFSYEEFSAAPDAGWPDLFNSGVFVFKPSVETYRALVNLADDIGSFDGGDQGLLNTYFSLWRSDDIRKHLSFLYNMHSTSIYTYSPAFAQFGNLTKVVHFVGAVKPWHHMYDRVTGTLYQVDSKDSHEERFIREWWCLYCITEDQANPLRKSTKTESLDQWKWKTNQIDYTGKDKFENLQKKMTDSMDESKHSRKTDSRHSSRSKDRHHRREKRGTSPEPGKEEEGTSPEPRKEKRGTSPDSRRRKRGTSPDSRREKRGTSPDSRREKKRGTSPEPSPSRRREKKRGTSPKLVPNEEDAESSPSDAVSDSSKFVSVHDSHQNFTQERFHQWRQGNVDFLGADKFDTIQAKIDESLKATGDTRTSLQS